ncbi:MAG: PD40 domain-containing protein [Bacteriovoracaceae bacterium]|nr:PD40 domain-containing protein [Bacteriovoracaceae bacterium]
MKKIIICIFIVIFPILAQSQEGLTVVAVGEATREQDKILFDGPYIKGPMNNVQIKMAEELMELFRNDFAFYKKSFSIEKGIARKGTMSGVKYQALRSKGISFLLRFEIEAKGQDSLQYWFEFHRVAKEEMLYSNNGNISKSKLRDIGHSLADSAYKKVTGKESIFGSKILFVSDKGSSRKNVVKELYMMDFDGRRRKKLTRHGGTVISPALSFDRTKVAYSLIRAKRGRKRNVNLYMMDLKTGKTRLLSSRKGLNTGAVFMPGDKSILLTLSHTGNAEIYEMNLQNKKIRKITKHFSPDVDPSIKGDGTMMAFLSGRSGAAMIYTANPNGVEKEVKRISYVGKFNATPRFSPDGKEIAFSSWLDNRFDIFRINSDGSGLSRLTKDFGSNEDPTYSNDGQFIAFSSQRVLSRTKATHNIYILDRDGEIVGQISKDFGNCITPRWSK